MQEHGFSGASEHATGHVSMSTVLMQNEMSQLPALFKVKNGFPKGAVSFHSRAVWSTVPSQVSKEASI
jgi:hypothetical protein